MLANGLSRDANSCQRVETNNRSDELHMREVRNANSEYDLTYKLFKGLIARALARWAASVRPLSPWSVSVDSDAGP